MALKKKVDVNEYWISVIGEVQKLLPVIRFVVNYKNGKRHGEYRFLMKLRSQKQLCGSTIVRDTLVQTSTIRKFEQNCNVDKKQRHEFERQFYTEKRCCLNLAKFV